MSIFKRLIWAIFRYVGLAKGWQKSLQEQWPGWYLAQEYKYFHQMWGVFSLPQHHYRFIVSEVGHWSVCCHFTLGSTKRILLAREYGHTRRGDICQLLTAQVTMENNKLNTSVCLSVQVITCCVPMTLKGICPAKYHVRSLKCISLTSVLYIKFSRAMKLKFSCVPIWHVMDSI